MKIFSEPSEASNRPACRQTSRKISCTASSASSELGDIRRAMDHTSGPYRLMQVLTADRSPEATIGNSGATGSFALRRSASSARDRPSCSDIANVQNAVSSDRSANYAEGGSRLFDAIIQKEALEITVEATEMMIVKT